MNRVQTRILVILGSVFLLTTYQTSQSEPPVQDRTPNLERSKIRIPKPLQIEHDHLHRQLKAAIQSGGQTAKAAQVVASRLASHFKREEQIAMPPLGLLTRLSQNKATKEEMQEILPLTEKLRDELPEMLKEHEQIVLALRELSEVANKENKIQVAQFADALILHARTEEEVLYPAAILVGEYIKLKLGTER